MIYNLVQFLRDEFPTIDIYANTREAVGTQAVVPDKCVLVRETGGDPGVWAKMDRPTTQIITRDNSSPGAKEIADDIFECINSTFGLILPEITVNTTTYPAIQTGQINALQRPTCLGKDEESRTEFVTNYQVHYKT